MKCGRKTCFHGAFSHKSDAKRKERKVHGFIQRVHIHGETRYLVRTRRKR